MPSSNTTNGNQQSQQLPSLSPSLGQQNQQQSNQKTGQTATQKVATPTKPVADITTKKAQNPIAVQPITVGESAKRYISIDKLLQEVK